MEVREGLKLEHVELGYYYISMVTMLGDSEQNIREVVIYLRSVIVNGLRGTPGGLTVPFKQWTFPLEYAETPTRALRKIYGRE